MNPYPKNKFLHLLAFTWMLPNVVLGAFTYLLLKITLNRPITYLNQGCFDVVFTPQSWFAKIFYNKGWAAVTLGNFIFYWSLDSYNTLTQFHERKHVQQQFTYGPLFYPYYLLLLLIGYLKYQDPYTAYLNHPLEVQAQNYAQTATNYLKQINQANLNYLKKTSQLLCQLQKLLNQ